MVKRGMDIYAELAPKLLRHAESLGYDLNMKTPPPPPTASPAKSKQTQAAERRLEKLRSNTHNAAKTQSQLPDGEDWIHEKYQRIEDFSLTMLRDDVISQIEPHSLSKPILRAMKVASEVDGIKAALLKISEFSAEHGVAK